MKVQIDQISGIAPTEVIFSGDVGGRSFEGTVRYNFLPGAASISVIWSADGSDAFGRDFDPPIELSPIDLVRLGLATWEPT